jgi:hypothetical protein
MPACPSCNAPIEPWVNSCPQCGMTLLWDMPSAPRPPAAVPQETPAQPEEVNDDKRLGYLLILGVALVILLCCACACLSVAIALGLEAGLSGAI